MPVKLSRAGTLLVFANGGYPPDSIVRRLLRKADAALCADGGSLHARRFRAFPRWIVGDLDSYPDRGRPFPGAKMIYDPDPDRSDLEKALQFARRLKPKRLWILGATGKRTDHFLANLGLLRLYRRFFEISFWAEDGELRLISGSCVLSGIRGRRVSVFPFHEKVRISLSGLQYSLKREWLHPGSRGVSNRAVSQRVKIRSHGGWLWVFREY